MNVKLKTGILIIFMLSAIQLLHGASLKLPQVVRPGALFVLALQAEPADSLINLQFDATLLQFLGAVQGTPEVQIKSDSEVEVKPETGKNAALYELQFIPLTSSGSVSIKMVHSGGSSEFPINVAAITISRGYSWVILVAAVILLAIGLKVWMFQRHSPEMMSTKSLFMNYEELEKARKQNFPDAASASEISADNPGSEAPEVSENAPPAAPTKESAGKKTLKHAAVKEKPLQGPLARVLNEESDEPASGANAVPQADKLPSEKPAVPLEPAPAASSAPPSGGKKTLKSKAVEAPALSGRLAEADQPDQPEKTPIQQAGMRPEPQSQPQPPKKEEPVIMPVKAVEKPFVAEPAPESPAKVEAPEQQPAGLVLPKERLVFSLEGNGKAYEAQGNVIRIGRRKENQICISASEISRDHVEISVSKGLVSVLPLTETNSTRLNGRTLTGKQIIKPGDTLNLGGTDFVVVKARAL